MNAWIHNTDMRVALVFGVFHPFICIEMLDLIVENSQSTGEPTVKAAETAVAGMKKKFWFFFHFLYL